MAEFISLSDYDDNRESKKDSLLDKNNLGSKKLETRLALCESCTIPRDVNGSPFIKYSFRDINGKIVLGRQFHLANIQEEVANIASYQLSIVYIEYTVNYWRGAYLEVKKCTPATKQVSDEIRNLFFVKDIPEMRQEIQLFEQISKSLFMGENIKKVFTEYSTFNKLRVGMNSELRDGMRGTSFSIVNSVSTLCMNHMDKKYGAEIMRADIFLEAIIASSEMNGANIFVELQKFYNICQTNQDPEVNSTYGLVESTLNLMYDIKMQAYNSNSLFLRNMRDSVISLMSLVNTVDNSIGVFYLDGRLFERR